MIYGVDKPKVQVFEADADPNDVSYQVLYELDIENVVARVNTTHQNRVSFDSENPVLDTLHERFKGYRFHETLTIADPTNMDAPEDTLIKAMTSYKRILELQKFQDDGYEILYIPHQDFGASGVIGPLEAASPGIRSGIHCFMSTAEQSRHVRNDVIQVTFIGKGLLPAIYDVKPTAEPTTAPGDPSFASITATTVRLFWTLPSTFAEAFIVTRKAGAEPSDLPVDGTVYSAGDTIGTSTVAYVGRQIAFNDTGLTAGTYYYRVYALNGHNLDTATEPDYLTSDWGEGNVTTV